jgi:hypothetical protein
MNDNNYRCQLSHIVIGLSVIVFYKLAKYYNLNKTLTTSTTKGLTEPFSPDSMTTSINDFISNTSVSGSILTSDQAKALSPSELTAYNDKLTQLINVLNDIKTQQVAPPANVAVSPDSIQKLDLESQQQYQMFQIDYLNKQIQNAKDIINAQTVANSSTNYKPIKVYSSCVISNADGSVSVDKPLNASAASQSIAGLQPNNSTTQQMLQTIGQQSGTQPTNASQFLNLSPSTGVFNNILNKLANGNVNINV